ncbi:MAG: hypothetical protein Ta2A_01590 [Treponemataceae bacterium]|nr:MAG: hypothetical protein Ta2A_01590 [Treponemataceae bacterium]
MSIKTVFGENLRYYRKQRHLTQEELAEKLDINPKYLGIIERGVNFASADLLEKITCELGVSASALFYSAHEKSADENFLSVIDRIIDAQLLKTAEQIKTGIRQAPTAPN